MPRLRNAATSEQVTDEQGFVAATLPLVLVVLLIFLGASFDISRAFAAWTQAQTVAAALARGGNDQLAGQALNGGTYSVNQAAANAAVASLAVSSHATASCAQMGVGGASTVSSGEACEVTVRVPMDFLQIIGIPTMTVSATAYSVTGGVPGAEYQPAPSNTRGSKGRGQKTPNQ